MTFKIEQTTFVPERKENPFDAAVAELAKRAPEGDERPTITVTVPQDDAGKTINLFRAAANHAGHGSRVLKTDETVDKDQNILSVLTFGLGKIREVKSGDDAPEDTEAGE